MESTCCCQVSSNVLDMTDTDALCSHQRQLRLVVRTVDNVEQS